MPSTMPAMSAAYQTLRHEQIARATTALNIIQRVAGSIGTALFSVVLATQLADRLPGAAGGGGLAAAQSVPASARAELAPKIADAFGHTFFLGVIIALIAFIPALFLPRRRPAPPARDVESSSAVPPMVEA